MRLSDDSGLLFFLLLFFSQAIVRLSDDSGLQLTIGKFRTLRDSIVSGRGIVPEIILKSD